VIVDSSLVLSYMQARYYDPVIGRFYGFDPVGFRDVHSFNRYAYAANNPYKYVDPDGKREKEPNLMDGDLGKIVDKIERAVVDMGQSIITNVDNLKQNTSETAGIVKYVTAGSAIVAGLTGQLEAVPPLLAVSGVAGYVEAATSEDPGDAIFRESVGNLTGAKFVSPIKTFVNALSSTKRASGAIEAAGVVTEGFISDLFTENKK